jgi:hypothetical protein
MPILLLPQMASSKDYIEASCNFYNAQYKPALGHGQQNDIFSYYITIKDNKKKERNKPQFFLELNVNDKKLGKKITSLEIPYACEGMSVRRCYLRLSSHKSDIAYMSMLGRDFTHSPITKKTPYALVIPQTAAIFNSIHWEKVETIKYFTNQRVKPDFRVPSIWTFEKCVK